MTPLVVIAGFLGAGKTTLLRTLVKELATEGAIPTVLLNDYKNAKVDAGLFAELDAVVKPISGACVCCDASWEMLEILDAYGHPEQGVVLLETNGTADAEETVALLASDPKLRRYSLPFQVGVIDAKRWQKRFWNNGLERDQAKVARRFFFGHLDEVDAAREAEVRAYFAEKFPATQAATAGELAEEIARMAANAGRGKEREIVFPRKRSPGGRGGTHEEKHHFSALEIALPEKVEREKLLSALRGLPPQILRAKGVVRFQDQPEKLWIFQKIHRSETAQLVPIEGEPKVKSPLAVFVAGSFPPGFPESFFESLGT